MKSSKFILYKLVKMQSKIMNLNSHFGTSSTKNEFIHNIRNINYFQIQFILRNKMREITNKIKKHHFSSYTGLRSVTISWLTITNNNVLHAHAKDRERLTKTTFLYGEISMHAI